MTLVLNSMHKYMPRLNIVEVSSRSSDPSSSQKSNSPPKDTFSFPETQFIAVTAYQNTDVSLHRMDELSTILILLISSGHAAENR